MNGKYDARLSPMTRLIYSELLLRCNYGSRSTRVTDRELAERFGLTERSVSRIVNLLWREGYLVKSRAHRKRTLSIAGTRLAEHEAAERTERSAQGAEVEAYEEIK